jgi:release factor glutamine methyltransferase
MQKFKLFYSWQSVRPPGFCRDFIKEALQVAIKKLPTDYWVDIKSDVTERTAGSPDISEEILHELRVCDVVVADLTPVASTDADVSSKLRSCANPNVAFEFGYALHAITSSRIILVENQYYGSNAEDFFDIRQRKLVRYKLGPESSEEDRTTASTGLAEKLFVELQKVLGLGNLYQPDLNDMYSKWWRGQNELRDTVDVGFEGLQFKVAHGVFSPDPRLTNSASMMARNMPQVKNKRVLDLGTGCGVLAVLAAKRGAREVLAVDILPEAVENAEENVRRHGVDDKVRVIEGDLFEHVDGEFEVILANLPIDPRQWADVKSITGVDILDIARMFLAQVRQRLAKKGVALITWASFGNMNGFNECLNELKFNDPQSLVTKREETFGVTWYLYVIRN